jgi:hypothetical protein
MKDINKLAEYGERTLIGRATLIISNIEINSNKFNQEYKEFFPETELRNAEKEVGKRLWGYLLFEREHLINFGLEGRAYEYDQRIRDLTKDMNKLTWEILGREVNANSFDEMIGKYEKVREKYK